MQSREVSCTKENMQSQKLSRTGVKHAKSRVLSAQTYLMRKSARRKIIRRGYFEEVKKLCSSVLEELPICHRVE